MFLDIGGEMLTAESLDECLSNFRSGERVFRKEVLGKQQKIRESLQGDDATRLLHENTLIDEIYSCLRDTLDRILEPPYFNLTDQSLAIVTEEIEKWLLQFFANIDLSQVPENFSFSRAKSQLLERSKGTIGDSAWDQRPGGASFL